MKALVRICIVAAALMAGATLTAVGAGQAQSDVTPPVVAELSISPKYVDTSAEPQIITITAHITDDLSGLRYLAIWFGPFLYDHDQDKSVVMQDTDIVSGTPTDGMYETTLTLPRYSADGRWIARYAIIDDQVGNRASCNTNGQMECPADWTTYYFVNIMDTIFHYLPFLSNRIE